MAGEALSLYRMLVHRGYAELDTGAVFKLYEPTRTRCAQPMPKGQDRSNSASSKEETR